MKVLSAIEKAVDFLCNIMTGIAALMMAALTLDVFLNVIFPHNWEAHCSFCGVDHDFLPLDRLYGYDCHRPAPGEHRPGFIFR